ncbi:MAG: hypothetical protein JNL57_10935 [Bacteroidetes bacterium]|nr:hypothetical protein [Bacteroidota bacterium]
MDLLRTGPSQRRYRAFKRYYLIVGMCSFVGSACLFFLVDVKVNFFAMLVLALSIVYALLKMSRLQSIAVFHPLLISVTVSLALFIPPLGTVQPALTILPVSASGFTAAWVVCLLNLLIFGFLEMDKDAALGNRTFFSGISAPILLSWLWIGTVVLCIAAAFFAYWYFTAIPVLCYSALVLLVLYFRQPLKKQGIYRLILDAGLLFLCL